LAINIGASCTLLHAYRRVTLILKLTCAVICYSSRPPAAGETRFLKSFRDRIVNSVISVLRHDCDLHDESRIINNNTNETNILI
jgi:hypothetical protein